MDSMRGVLAFVLAATALMASDLAPTGTLRAAFLGANPVQGHIDAQTGAITGPVADIVKEMARKLGVPFAILPASGASGVIALIKSGKADIGFLAYDEARSKEVNFAGPYALMYNTYVVADRSGVKIGAVRGQTQETFLTANIKSAQLKVYESQPPQPELERLLTSGELQAFAANRQRMEDAAAKSSKLRALSDNFLVVVQEIVIDKGDDPAKLAEIDRLIDEMRASGFIKASLDRAKISGVDVAPAAKR